MTTVSTDASTSAVCASFQALLAAPITNGFAGGLKRTSMAEAR